MAHKHVSSERTTHSCALGPHECIVRNGFCTISFDSSWSQVCCAKLSIVRLFLAHRAAYFPNRAACSVVMSSVPIPRRE